VPYLKQLSQPGKKLPLVPLCGISWNFDERAPFASKTTLIARRKSFFY
jgi:hypothetical protein